MRSPLPAALALAALLAGAVTCRASTTEKLPVRGQVLTLAIYPAHGQARGTILMGSGDVGWVGLAVSLAAELSNAGYTVIGINVRQYLAAFTSAKTHLQAADVAGDYRTISAFAASRNLLVAPVVVSGVSEGAALAVLAGADPANHVWIDGVLTMGLPPTAELAWRWSDVSSWITRRDPAEPSFAPADVIGRIAPLPIYMIQSTKDEYVTPADYQRFQLAAAAPKQLVLIDASNHRFTDRRGELSAAVARGLAWIAERSPRRP